MNKKDEKLEKPESPDSAQFHSRSAKGKEKKATPKATTHTK